MGKYIKKEIVIQRTENFIIALEECENPQEIVDYLRLLVKRDKKKYLKKKGGNTNA